MAELKDFNYIEKNLIDIREKINKAVLKRDNIYNKPVRLLAVTKTVDVDRINFAISKGVNLIGENKVNELLDKYDKLDKLNKDGLEIHFIGNLQTNKVKYIIDKVNLIQSVNSLKLAEEINKRANQNNIIMDVLIEINIGAEDSKIGITPESALEFLTVLKDFENIRVKGLMTIPPYIRYIRFEENNMNNTAENGENQEIKKYFLQMYKIFVDISEKKIDNITMDTLSMGMSEDYECAILCGADTVRIGRGIFGERT